MPFLVSAAGDSMEYSLDAFFTWEEAHRPGSPSYLPKSSLQHVGIDRLEVVAILYAIVTE
jgi:hypothetical protein